MPEDQTQIRQHEVCWTRVRMAKDSLRRLMHDDNDPVTINAAANSLRGMEERDLPHITRIGMTGNEKEYLNQFEDYLWLVEYSIKELEQRERNRYETN